MVTAVVESPLRQRQRLRSPLATSTTSASSVNGAGADFEFRHWRPVKRASAGGMRGRRWAPPDIEIPRSGGNGAARGYTSLRDIMSSPEYAKAAAAGSGSSCCSPDEAVVGDVHMIRHPLVKHAAYAYLQLTPSGRDAEEAWRRRQRRRGVLGRLLSGCLGFLGALFGRR